MPNDMSRSWSQYRPSKTLWFWSCVGVAALTMAIGFSAGGWVTGATAAERAEAASEAAVAELAASICADRFMAASDAQSKLAQLKEVDSWKQDNFIEEGGWVTFANMENPVTGAADMCADKVLATAPTADESGA